MGAEKTVDWTIDSHKAQRYPPHLPNIQALFYNLSLVLFEHMEGAENVKFAPFLHSFQNSRLPLFTHPPIYLQVNLWFRSIRIKDLGEFVH